ncbi:unnamed protein product [Sphagnum balticum]
MKMSTLTYARNTWTDEYGDDEYNELLSECSLQCQLPKELGQKRHQWRCKFCTEVFKSKPSLNYHRYRGCPKIGHRLKMYPMVGKGKRDVVKHACSQKGFTIAAIPEGTEWLLGSVPQMNVESHGSLASFPAGSKGHKHGMMEGHMDFIQECAVEDEMWKWSPLYLLLRDFSLLSTKLPRPWKHTAEEWDFVEEFIVMDLEGHSDITLIVAALAFTWTFHFHEDIENVDLNKLPDQLEHLSQEKEFGNNLSRFQRIMVSQFALESQEQQILANDIASFKATSESPGHQEVIKRVCNYFVGIAHEALEDMINHHPQKNVKDMWIGGHLECDRETLIKSWNDTLSTIFTWKRYGVGYIDLDRLKFG